MPLLVEKDGRGTGALVFELYSSGLGNKRVERYSSHLGASLPAVPLVRLSVWLVEEAIATRSRIKAIDHSNDPFGGFTIPQLRDADLMAVST